MHKVVLVDDEPMVCKWLTDKIDWRKWQCEVVAVGSNGLEGLELVEAHQPDILISDVKMPGISGLELAKRVQERYPKILVLILSGYSEFDYVRSAMRNNAFDYLLKPIETDELRRAMDKAISHLEEQLEREHHDEINVRKLEESSELTESGVLMNLIMNGNKDLPVLQNKMARLGLDLGKGQVVVYQLHENTDPQKKKWISLYQYAVRNILSETFEKFHLVPVVLQIGDRCVVVAKFSAGISIPLWEKRVLEAAGEGLENVQMYLKSAQSVGVGTVFKSIDQLHSAYWTAVQSLELQYFWLDASISSANIPASALDTAPFEINPSLYESIENGNEEAAIAQMTAIAAKLRKIGKREFVYSVCTEMLIHLSKISSNWNKEPDFLSLMNGMKEFQTYNELMQELTNTVTSLCIWISEQKTYALASLPEKIVIYVREHYQNPDITLATISDKFHISLSHISRIFVRATGMNFNEFLSHLRVEQAKQLMEREHWLSNQEIAKRVGYHEGRYFGQVFKKHTGKTPNEYRGRRELKL